MDVINCPYCFALFPFNLKWTRIYSLQFTPKTKLKFYFTTKLKGNQLENTFLWMKDICNLCQYQYFFKISLVPPSDG